LTRTRWPLRTSSTYVPTWSPHRTANTLPNRLLAKLSTRIQSTNQKKSTGVPFISVRVSRAIIWIVKLINCHSSWSTCSF
jgi:hypothetical protein